MKITCIADLHGNLPRIEPCDLLLIAGDVTWSPDVHASRIFMEGPFSEWLVRVPAQEIIGIAGNHEFIAEEDPAFVGALPWTYLQDSGVVIDGLRIHGAPWSNTFGAWAFMAPENELAERWALIPDDTQILLTHGPAYLYGDRVHRGLNVGSVTLYERTEKLYDLRLHVCGHIHEDFGVWRRHDRLTVVNASYVNLMYRPRPVRMHTFDRKELGL